MASFEIYRRDPGMRLAGSWAIRIDGYDSWFTCHPHQFARKAAQLLAAQGVAAGVDLAVAIGEVSDEFARRSLQRVIKEIKSGKRGAGGGILTKDVSGAPMADFVARVAQGMTAREYDRWMDSGYVPETKAAERFMQRGKLAELSDVAKKRNLLKPFELTDQELQQRRIEHRIRKLEERLRGVEARPQTAARDTRILELTAELESLKSATVLAASHGFQFFFGELLHADTDMVSGDIRIVPLMTNTTADTERDAVDEYSDFTTPDLFDGANAPTTGSALDSQAVNIDDGNDRAEFDADDEVRTALGAGTRSIQGELLIEFISTLAGSLPQFWIEYAAVKTPDGSDFTVVFNAEGLLQVSG